MNNNVFYSLEKTKRLTPKSLDFITFFITHLNLLELSIIFYRYL